jgi:hypothetical protein
MAKKRRQPIQAPEAMTDMPFPLQGIDVSCEFEQQPPQTTPVGKNVRGYEPGTMRARGGSRPGLSEYVPVRVNGANLIQHLNYVVDPQEAALLTGFDPVAGGATIADPSTNDPSDPFGQRNPGRAVRPGGSGSGLNRHRYRRLLPTPTILPKDEAKLQGQTFTFAGTEFTATGLLPGDKILSVTLTSAGAPASAAPGNYSIGAAFAVGNASFIMNLGMGKYNPPVYLAGNFFVNSASPFSAVLIDLTVPFGSGLGFVLASRNVPGVTSGTTMLGLTSWRVIQYLNVTNGLVMLGSPLAVESGTVNVGDGTLNGFTQPASYYVRNTVVVSQPYYGHAVLRLEGSPDGTTWPPPPSPL